MKDVEFISREENLHYPNVWDIEPKDLMQILNQNKQIKLIDVRMDEEFTNSDLGHIPNSRLLRLDKLVRHVDQFEKDENLVFICRSGGRSARAAALFAERGFRNVFNLKGGMLYWRELNFEVEGNRP
jgi:hydroxyacylglutathione hydrolase